MREALAKSDLDFVVSKSDAARRKPDATRLPKILRVASIATAALFCTVIIVNALFLQDRKHAAPLLRAPDPVDAPPAAAMPVPAPPRPVAAAPAPAPSIPTAPTRPGRDVIADEINRGAPAATPDRKPAKPAPAKPADERRDPIASLIGGTQEPSPSILAAQKALLRLGYVVRADGVAGTSTRQAIESYERDHKLPVRGELTPKILRELAAKAALATQ